MSRSSPLLSWPLLLPLRVVGAGTPGALVRTVWGARAPASARSAAEAVRSG